MSAAGVFHGSRLEELRMVKEIDVATWEEFVEKLRDIRSSEQPTKQPLLFRGQSDSRWTLAASLDRRNNEGMHFEEYYRVISSAKAKIETLTNTTWTIPSYLEVIKLVENYDSMSLAMSFGKNPAYEYMAYLRHHGFPSPLLDWSQSPYVAAYFAFSKAINSSSVSIYVLSHAKFNDGGSGLPRVHRFGPNVKVHRRHVLQQSEYTMCLVCNSDRAWRFANYDDALKDSKVIDGIQWNLDIMKINIPSLERLKVLRVLDEHNLNAFSLFGSEESLMETIAMRELSS
jgi:hypothetical protein